MKVTEIILTDKDYDNWVKYTNESISADFDEYKDKEFRKWKDRASDMGIKFPIFDSLKNMKELCDNAKVINIDSAGNVNNLTKNTTIQNVKEMVDRYTTPRDVDRIVDGIKNNIKLPLPIILKGNNGMFILAGNTRQAVTRILGAVPKALLIDVKEK